MVQRIPNNGGGAVTGPVTVSDQTLTVSGNSASVSVPWTDVADGYTVTLVPPSNNTASTVAVAQHSGQCLDDTNLSAADGTNQMFTLKPVTALGNSKDYQLAAVHSGKCMGCLPLVPGQPPTGLEGGVGCLRSRVRSTGHQIARSVLRRVP